MFYRTCANFVTRFAGEINRQVCRQIARVSREYKNCDNSDWLRKTHATLAQSSKPVKNRKNPTDLNGCRQSLLFARQLTQRKCSLCSQGREWTEYNCRHLVTPPHKFHADDKSQHRWVHQCGIFALGPQTSSRRETSGGVAIIILLLIIIIIVISIIIIIEVDVNCGNTNLNEDMIVAVVFAI